MMKAFRKWMLSPMRPRSGWPRQVLKLALLVAAILQSPAAGAVDIALLQNTSSAASSDQSDGLTASKAAAAAGASTYTVVYNCSLSMQGFALGINHSSYQYHGLRSASLHCTSVPAGARALQVAYNYSIIGDRLTTNYPGVHPVFDSSKLGKSLGHETVLLYFNSSPHTLVQFWQPTVSSISLDIPNSSNTWDRSLLAFGGNMTVRVEGGLFMHNHAGTVFMLADGVHMIVRGTHVVNNTAKGGGALRLSDSSTASVEHGALFANNTAFYGGAVYMSGATKLSVMAAKITGNTAYKDPYIDADDQTGIGGGIYATNHAIVSITNNSSIDQNVALNGGGIKLEDHAVCDISGGVVISRNNASGTAGTGGGIYAAHQAKVVVSNASIVGNYASKQGGGIALEDGSSTGCTITSRTAISNNKAEVQGGGLYLGPGSGTEIGGGSTVAHNQAKNGGGILLSAEDSKGHTRLVVKGDHTRLENNFANSSGPAINVFAASEKEHKCLVEVSDGVVIDNGQQSHAAFESNGMCSAIFDDMTFVCQGCIRFVGLTDNAQATIANCHMCGASAVDGAAVVLEDKSHATFINSTLYNNTASGFGGFLMVHGDGAGADFINSTIEHCSAASGGAIVIEGIGTVVLNNSTLRFNNASNTGGAVYLLSSGPQYDPASLQLINSTCTNNTATSGGCIYASIYGNVVLDNSSSINYNTATRYGGGIVFAAFGSEGGSNVAFDTTVTTLEHLYKNPQLLNNSAGVYGNDTYVEWTEVSLAMQSCVVNNILLPPDVWSHPGSIITYVDRSAGPGLNITLTAHGSAQGRLNLPAQGVRIEAFLLHDNATAADRCNGNLGSVFTDDNGTAIFLNQPHLPCGNHSIAFGYAAWNGSCVLALHYVLHVRPCGLGEYTFIAGNLTAPTICDVCHAGQYCLSSNPGGPKPPLCNRLTTNCDLGGAVVFPLPGFWQRSPASALMSRCPFPSACSGNATLLHKCHPYRHLSYDALAPFNVTPAFPMNSSPHDSITSDVGLRNTTEQYFQQQCAQGYTGNLCAMCQPGYGMTAPFKCSKCMQSVGKLAAIYACGAVALLILIRIMMYLSTTSDSASVRSWKAAARANQQVLPTRAAAEICPTDTDAGGAGVVVRALPSSVFKVLVLYMQYILIISSLAVDWPVTVLHCLKPLATLWSGASSEAVAVECMLPRYYGNGTNITRESPVAVPVGLLHALAYLCVPIAMFTILLLLECIWRASRPWSVSAYTRCLASFISRFDSHTPDFIKRHHMRISEQGCVPAAHPLGNEAGASKDIHRRTSDVVIEHPLPAASCCAPASRRNMAGVEQGVMPTVAWCGVLGMVTVFFFLTSLARAALSLVMYHTMEADEGAGVQKLWLPDLNQEYSAPQPRHWALGLGLPAMVLVYGCWPIGVGVLLYWYSHKQQLLDEWVLKHFGFLYVHYRTGCYLWEVVMIIQTLLIVVVSVALGQLGVYNQALLLNIVLAVICTSMMWFKPMASSEVQVLNYVALGMLMFTTYVAMSFTACDISYAAQGADAGTIVNESQQTFRLESDFERYKFVMGVLLVCANAAFIAGCVFSLVRALLPPASWRKFRAAMVHCWRESEVACRIGCERIQQQVRQCAGRLL